ncbi:MAG: methylenetetrahydrofolate--tRNA-(uracil(54)-C(5))-methyltransferase (FADH(2)-oxidizing) TrmFO [Deltaproteobacteria bacterium]|nr:methylenetetrahydrofolate--tRNA-(uracil(54)-C(5))-methyltransferase (FADH(2)-oxidizing) TrmFO [Deltaproteobacteria bacterium]
MPFIPQEDLLVTIVGAGLAGSEAAWQAAQAGVRVRLYEMKPQRFSPAHRSEGLAELVCSNSLRGDSLTNAVGCLKEELRRCRTLFMEAAEACRVAAGGSLAVDREQFSAYIGAKLEAHSGIELIRGEVVDIPEGEAVILASGPLTSEALEPKILALAGAGQLYFYDAIAPIVDADSLDYKKIWRASRYDKGGADYLNCPLTEEEYRRFVAELKAAEKVPYRDFEKGIHFEGCMPIEILAERGEMTLAFGPMKPVGLKDPRTGREPFAVVQLRKENRAGTLFNLVGFQTKLTYPEQRRLLRLIPGLENARFTRLGSMHRNTFINAPRCLDKTLQWKDREGLFCAGQLSGVEGYVESAATGFLAGIAAAFRLRKLLYEPPPPTTALGSLLTHLTESDPEHFQPMNVNYGLFPLLAGKRPRGRSEVRLALARRALDDVESWWGGIEKQRGGF